MDDVDPAPARGLLSAEELARADGIGSPELRRRFLARRWMRRELLREAPQGVWWSASSSGGLAAVALSPWRVGIDVERRRERRRWEGIARRRYTADEQRAVAGSVDRFLEFWTFKEAYLKALGLGLAGGLDSLQCTGLCRSSGDWMESAGHPGWRFRQLQPEPGFVAALAVEGAPERIEVRRWVPSAGAASAGRADT
ncbi:MAG TPA: 4'-phosphopantetheinyl transferase superfamily protein [Solirubrobacterales bacterium]|nr:4'-phosphopantetheinyl transferase superfamily protein [Solirubrobacterales bacterium]